MTCSFCGHSLLTHWNAADGTPCMGFTLSNSQPVLIGSSFMLKGHCGECRKLLLIPDPEGVLRNTLVIPVVRQESTVIAVKVRRA